MMKIRAKIGFMAFKQNYTILELLLIQIKRTYLSLIESKDIKLNLVQKLLLENRTFENIINEGFG
jgi:hypothetical protein